MLSFLVLLWNHRSDDECRAAEATERTIGAERPLWKRGFSSQGLSVYCPAHANSEGDVIFLPDKCGLLLGVAFRSGALVDAVQRAEDVQSFLSRITPALRASRGAYAIGALWGSYILILIGPDSESHYVLRSPASLLPCFHAQLDRVHVLFSEVEDFLSLVPHRASINWSLIRAQAAEHAYVTRDTGITGIDTLESGECLRHTFSGITRTFYWNPVRLSTLPAISDFAAAAAALRRETLRAVYSWASRHNSILLELSGGIDSSIVLSCLATAPTSPRILGVNFYSNHLPVDERAFARSMARKAQIQLREIPKDLPWDLSVFAHCARTARPVLDLTAPGRLTDVRDLANVNSCDAVFDGELGDDVFGLHVGPEPLLDCLKSRKFLHFLVVARDLARIRRTSIWRVVGQSILPQSRSLRFGRTRARARPAEDIDTEAFRLVTKETLLECDRGCGKLVHPWFLNEVAPSPSSLPLIHALVMATSTAYHSPFLIADSPPTIRPLISQPLIEVALRIPGGLSVRRGWNRAVARAAFSSDLSDEVRRRTCKTDMTPWVRQAIRGNLSWLREFLLGGILARERILDRSRVDAVLSETVNCNDILINHLFVQLYIEGWLRQWVS